MAKPDSSATASSPDFSIESRAYRAGAQLVAGIDEAGRGPLAGPVVVAAAAFPTKRYPQGLNDSKKLTADQREALFAQIVSRAVISVVVAPPDMIDTLNIRGATLWAMRQAAISLCPTPCHVLIDGRDLPPGLPCDGEAVIGGDGKSVSIAAASIVAKVVRDRMCETMDCDGPGYAFSGHKGYGTAAHMAALTSLGPSIHHRRSFAPVAAARKL